MCGKPETSDHILFQCPPAVFLWSFLRTCLGWSSSPTNCESLFRDIIHKCRGGNQGVMLFICAGALWSTWKARNDVVFNKKVLLMPESLIHKMIMLIKAWSPLLKPKMKPIAEEMILALSAGAASV